MVKICDIDNYPSENEEKYKEHFTKFKYPLHIFQKWAIEAIVEGHHVLATAPTGSGKSLPAEFSLDFFRPSNHSRIRSSLIFHKNIKVSVWELSLATFVVILTQVFSL